MVVIGMLISLFSVATGYLLHHGPMHVFVDAWTEFVLILGSAVGVFLTGNGMVVTKRTIAEIKGLLKPSPYTEAQFLELMTMLFQLFVVARKDGLLALEPHAENPEKSVILSRYSGFLHNHHAVEFLSDNLKMIISGVTPTDLNELMETDLEAIQAEGHVVPESIQNAADAMPALGIVACVLGVIITMNKIGGAPQEIGMSVAVALVGTFLGIAVSYLAMAPLARAVGLSHGPEIAYLSCIRNGLFCLARGQAPSLGIEFARRHIPPSLRPSFEATADACKQAGKGG